MVRHGFSAEINPEDPAHQAWFAGLQKLLAEVPQGLICHQDAPFELREVTVDDLFRHLQQIRYASYTLHNDAERMWDVLVQLCGKWEGADVPADRELAKHFPLPLAVVKRVALGHFAGSQTTKRTQETLLRFIATL